MDTQEFYEKITSAAYRHGRNSDPEHEVGDLQDAVWEMAKEMSRDQLGAVYDRLANRFHQLEE